MTEEFYQGELSDDDLESLVKYRGGCSCHLSPPCHNHVEPVTMEEAIYLGLVEEDIEPPLKNINFEDGGTYY